MAFDDKKFLLRPEYAEEEARQRNLKESAIYNAMDSSFSNNSGWFKSGEALKKSPLRMAYAKQFPQVNLLAVLAVEDADPHGFFIAGLATLIGKSVSELLTIEQNLISSQAEDKSRGISWDSENAENEEKKNE